LTAKQGVRKETLKRKAVYISGFLELHAA